MNILKKIFESKYNRIIRYLISGGSVMATDLVVLFILTHFFRLWYLLSAVIAFIAAVIVSFTMQKFFTFNDQSRDTIHKQMVFYLSLQVFNLFLNTWLMYIGVDLLHFHYLVSQISISALMAISNFFIYKHLVFSPDRLR